MTCLSLGGLRTYPSWRPVRWTDVVCSCGRAAEQAWRGYASPRLGKPMERLCVMRLAGIVTKGLHHGAHAGELTVFAIKLFGEGGTLVL